MYLLYLDDSGSPGNSAEKYFVLGGVCLFERQVHWLCEELDTVVRDLNFPGTDIADIELRATNILSGKNRWRKMARDTRREVVAQALRAMDRIHARCRVFAVAVDKAAISPTDPVEYAFEQLANRFDLFLLRLHRSGDTQRGLMVLDNSSQKERLRQLASQFKIDGHRWGSIRNMSDVPFFVDSKATRTIQYADLVAHSVWRYYEKNEDDLFNVIRDRFDAEGGVNHGLVHFKNPRTECACPACRS